MTKITRQQAQTIRFTSVYKKEKRNKKPATTDREFEPPMSVYHHHFDH